MKIIFGPRRYHYRARSSIFLLVVALVVGTVGYGGSCVVNPPSEDIEIHDWYDLDDVRNNLAGSHILMNNLDSTTTGYEELAGPNGNEGMSWLPVGTEDDPFTGSLEGQGYKIRDLIVSCGSGASHAGVFGFVDEGGQIEDIGVVDADVCGPEVAGGLVGVCYGTVTDSYFTGDVTGHECAGGLVGISYGAVTNSHSTGSVSGESGVGGLVGWNGNEGTVSNSHSSSDTTGFVIGVGGLVGRNEGTVSNSHAMGTVICSDVVAGGLVGVNEGTVTNSYSTGNVTGDREVGGLVGINGWYMNGYSNPGTVTNSYSTGNVTGEDDVGGLVGGNGWDSIVIDSYATGNVDGEREVGGLVGTNVGSVGDSYSTSKLTGEADVGGLVGGNYDIVSNSYSTGSVTGNSSVGGLVGLIDEGNVSNSYSTGNVTGVTYVGGLVGENEDSVVTNSFWDTETSGQATSAGGTGKTTAQMKNIATFSGVGWDVIAVADPSTRSPAYIWNIVDDESYPFLSWQP